MKRKLVMIVVALQILVLMGMAAKRETIRALGDEIYLRSAPIDPRDPFRGDFVRLDYLMSVVGADQLQGIPSEYLTKKGRVVYAVLKEDGNGLYSLDHVTAEQPEGGIFIKGRTDNYRYSQPDQLRVKYGIEQYFVQQGKGLEMESKLGTRTGLQIPIEMRIAIGGDGTAVITGHRWSELGVQLEVTRSVDRATDTDSTEASSRSPAVRITLKNVSPEPLLLANPGNNCAFHLVDATVQGARLIPADTQCSQVNVSAEDVHTLAPKESYSVNIDLVDPRWHLWNGNNREEIGAVQGFRRFRFEYRSPTREEAQQLGDSDSFWIGTMPTPAFSNRGRVD